MKTKTTTPMEMRKVLMKIVVRLWDEFPNLDHSVGFNPRLVEQVRRRYLKALRDVAQMADLAIAKEVWDYGTKGKPGR